MAKENKDDLERVQKTALKVILGERFKTYKNALYLLDLQTLDERRERLCLNLAKRAAKQAELGVPHSKSKLGGPDQNVL